MAACQPYLAWSVRYTENMLTLKDANRAGECGDASIYHKADLDKSLIGNYQTLCHEKEGSLADKCRYSRRANRQINS